MIRLTALRAALGLALMAGGTAPALAQDWGWRGRDAQFDRAWHDRGWDRGWDGGRWNGRWDDGRWDGGRWDGRWDRRDDWRWRERQRAQWRFNRFADLNRDGFVSRREYRWARERLARGGGRWGW